MQTFTEKLKYLISSSLILFVQKTNQRFLQLQPWIPDVFFLNDCYNRTLPRRKKLPLVCINKTLLCTFLWLVWIKLHISCPGTSMHVKTLFATILANWLVNRFCILLSFLPASFQIYWICRLPNSGMNLSSFPIFKYVFPIIPNVKRVSGGC